MINEELLNEIIREEIENELLNEWNILPSVNPLGRIARLPYLLGNDQNVFGKFGGMTFNPNGDRAQYNTDGNLIGFLNKNNQLTDYGGNLIPKGAQLDKQGNALKDNSGNYITGGTAGVGNKGGVMGALQTFLNKKWGFNSQRQFVNNTGKSFQQHADEISKKLLNYKQMLDIEIESLEKHLENCGKDFPQEFEEFKKNLEKFKQAIEEHSKNGDYNENSSGDTDEESSEESSASENTSTDQKDSPENDSSATTEKTTLEESIEDRLEHLMMLLEEDIDEGKRGRNVAFDRRGNGSGNRKDKKFRRNPKNPKNFYDISNNSEEENNVETPQNTEQTQNQETPETPQNTEQTQTPEAPKAPETNQNATTVGNNNPASNTAKNPTNTKGKVNDDDVAVGQQNGLIGMQEYQMRMIGDGLKNIDKQIYQNLCNLYCLCISCNKFFGGKDTRLKDYNTILRLCQQGKPLHEQIETETDNFVLLVYNMQKFTQKFHSGQKAAKFITHPKEEALKNLKIAENLTTIGNFLENNINSTQKTGSSLKVAGNKMIGLLNEIISHNEEASKLAVNDNQSSDYERMINGENYNDIKGQQQPSEDEISDEELMNTLKARAGNNQGNTQ